MVNVVGFTNSLASGELSPDAWERSDLQQHAAGCEQAFNFIGLTSGPIASRGGFIDVGFPKSGAAQQRLFRWDRADGEALVLEWGEAYVRVWTASGARVLDGGGHQVEFFSPYSAGNLPRLRLAQVGDIAYVTSGDGLLNTVLVRYRDDFWNFEIYPLKDGPYLPENTDEAKTFTLTDNGDGTWSIVSNFDIFDAGHVGALFRIRGPSGAAGVASWAPATLFGAGQWVLSAGRIYSNESGAIKSGNTPPNHDRGTVFDGAINWKFRHDGQGYVQVTVVTDPRHITCVVPFDLPIATGGATSNWSEQAFSAFQGYPTALAAVREERLVLAASAKQPSTVQLSRTAGFNPTSADFKPGLGTGLVADDDAVTVTVGGEGSRIVWAVDALNLVIGTAKAEWIVSGAGIDDPISPASVKPRRISSHGSAEVMPVVIQGPPAILLHIARGGRTLRELQLASAAVDPQGRELSVLSQHIFGLGVTEMAWSQPDNNLWLLLADGSLAVLTYHFEEQVIGARRQPLPGGFRAETLCTSPGPDGVDRLHVGVVRDTVDGAQRTHLVLATRDQGIFLDLAQQYVGAPTAEVAGLNLLQGSTVAILADGGQVEDQVVAPDGTITLDEPASNIIVGLRMLRRFKSLPFDPNHDGQAVAKKGRPVACYVVFGGVTAKVYAEPQNEPTDDVPLFEQVDTRRPGDAIPTVRRKREKVTLSGGADRDNRLVVETDDPFDLVIYAVRPVQDEQ